MVVKSGGEGRAGSRGVGMCDPHTGLSSPPPGGTNYCPGKAQTGEGVTEGAGGGEG